MGRKKKGGKKEAELEAEELTEEEDEAGFQIAVLEIRVKELETLNTGLQAKYDYISNQSEDFRLKLQQTTEENELLIAHLTRCYSEERTNVKELEDRLFGLRQARSDEAKEYERRLVEKDNEFEDMKIQLDKKILELNMTLTSLEDFKVQKEILEGQLQDLKKELESEKEKFDKEYNLLEDRLIFFRDKLQQDAKNALEIMAKKVETAGKLNLATNIKTNISENVNLKSELENTSKSNLELREKVQNLQQKDRESRMSIKILEEQNTLAHSKYLEYKKLSQILAQNGLETETKLLQAQKDLSQTQLESQSNCKCRIQDQEKMSQEDSKEEVVVENEDKIDTHKNKSSFENLNLLEKKRGKLSQMRTLTSINTTLGYSTYNTSSNSSIRQNLHSISKSKSLRSSQDIPLATSLSVVGQSEDFVVNIFTKCKNKPEGRRTGKIISDEFENQKIEKKSINLQDEHKKFKEIILSIAIASKELTEASNPEEMSHLKRNFKACLVKVYEVACDLPDLSKESKSRLTIYAPKVNEYLEI